MMASQADAGLIANADLRADLETLSRSYDANRSVRAYTAVDEALAALERNANAKGGAPTGSCCQTVTPPVAAGLQTRLSVMKPRIAITVGDPAGIGPEIARKAADDARVRDVCEPVLYGPPPEHTFPMGQLSADAGRAAFDAVCAAVRDAQAGAVHAVATAPVNKLAFSRAGLPWKGHTDLLAHLTGSPRVAMMFWSEPLKVVLATIHVPLASVPAALTRERARRHHRSHRRASCRASASRAPRLALAGLNPHAGEDGLLGTEDERGAAPGGRGRPGARRPHRRPVSRPTRCSCAPRAASSTP